MNPPSMLVRPISNMEGEKMKSKWTLLATLALAFSPALALAHPVSSPAVRVHSAEIHAHAPQAHVHTMVAHH